MLLTKNYLILTLATFSIFQTACGKSGTTTVTSSTTATETTTTTSTACASSTVFTSDSFDNRSSLGDTDIANCGAVKTWTMVSGTSVNLSGNSIGRDSASGVPAINASSQNCSVQAKLKNIPTGNGATGILGRASSDAATGFAFIATPTTSNYRMMDLTGATTDASPAIAPADGDVLRLEFSGNSVVIKINGTDVSSNFGNMTVSATDTSSNSYYGIFLSNASGRMDDFVIENCR